MHVNTDLIKADKQKQGKYFFQSSRGLRWDWDRTLTLLVQHFCSVTVFWELNMNYCLTETLKQNLILVDNASLKDGHITAITLCYNYNLII